MPPALLSNSMSYIMNKFEHGGAMGDGAGGTL